MLEYFFQEAFIRNYWLWFHIFAAGFLARLLRFWFSRSKTLLIILILIIGWEIFEFYHESVMEVYGSWLHFAADTFGDLTGALLMTIIVVSDYGKRAD
ncbi:MAG: hypothetical protein WAN36_05960 [Calditrichia bacterium]